MGQFLASEPITESWYEGPTIDPRIRQGSRLSSIYLPNSIDPHKLNWERAMDRGFKWGIIYSTRNSYVISMYYCKLY